MTERLARHAALHPKRMVAIWGAVFVLSVAAIAVLLPSAITTDAHVTNDPESEQGYAAPAGMPVLRTTSSTRSSSSGRPART